MYTDFDIGIRAFFLAVYVGVPVACGVVLVARALGDAITNGWKELVKAIKGQ